MREDLLTLSDGRKLSYAQLGSPTGPAVFYFHGTPGSRLELAPLDDDLTQRGIRMISPERPGCGDSTPQPGRRLTAGRRTSPRWPTTSACDASLSWGSPAA